MRKLGFSGTSPLLLPIADIGADIAFRPLGPQADIRISEVTRRWRCSNFRK